MKHIAAFLILTALLAGNTLSAQPVEEQPTRSERIAAIEPILMEGLWSDAPKQLRGATFAVRRLSLAVPEYDWDRFIIPLMHVLNDERHDPGARIMAAVVLHDLRSERGDFLIAREAEFCDDCRVRRYCVLFARCRAAEEQTSFAAETTEE